MNSLIIAYEIGHSGSPGADYQPLYEAIRAYGTWARITESCWAVRTEQTTVQVRDSLQRLLRAGDRLFVVQTAHVAAWNNTLCRNEWLKENV